VKVLVDSCVWSYSLRRNKDSLNPEQRNQVALLAEYIKDGRVAIVGPVRQEVLSGVKGAEEFEKLRIALSAFSDEPIRAFDYEQAARLDNMCRRAGVMCGSVDMLLCAVAEQNHWTILTNDAGLLRCIEIVEQQMFTAKAEYKGRRLRD
jgi:predicted nucleic acid-binding protein